MQKILTAQLALLQKERYSNTLNPQWPKLRETSCTCISPDVITATYRIRVRQVGCTVRRHLVVGGNERPGGAEREQPTASEGVSDDVSSPG